MTEIEIVKKLFIALSNSSVITVVSSDGKKTIGHIAKFDGNCVVVDNREILLSEITSIEEPTDDAAENANNESVDTDFSQFKTKKARIKYKNNNNIEEEQGILFDFKDNTFDL